MGAVRHLPMGRPNLKRGDLRRRKRCWERFGPCPTRVPSSTLPCATHCRHHGISGCDTLPGSGGRRVVRSGTDGVVRIALSARRGRGRAPLQDRRAVCCPGRGAWRSCTTSHRSVRASVRRTNAPTCVVATRALSLANATLVLCNDTSIADAVRAQRCGRVRVPGVAIQHTSACKTPKACVGATMGSCLAEPRRARTLPTRRNCSRCSRPSITRRPRLPR